MTPINLKSSKFEILPAESQCFTAIVILICSECRKEKKFCTSGT
jgi:hypothetical protein